MPPASECKEPCDKDKIKSQSEEGELDLIREAKVPLTTIYQYQSNLEAYICVNYKQHAI